MASVDIRCKDKFTDVHFYSCLPERELQHWLTLALRLPMLSEVRMLWYEVEGKRWYYFYLLFYEMNKASLSHTSVFDDLFPKEMTNRYLYSVSTGTAKLVPTPGRLKRWGSVADPSVVMTDDEKLQCNAFVKLISASLVNSENCYQAFQAMGDGRLSDECALQLSREFSIDGGSWMIYPPLKDKIRSANNTVVEVSPGAEESKMRSLTSFRLMAEAVLSGLLRDVEFVCRIQWNCYQHELIPSFLVKVSHTETSYYSDKVSGQAPEGAGEEWFYSRDVQVHKLYKLVRDVCQSMRGIHMRYKYKSEIVSVCDPLRSARSDGRGFQSLRLYDTLTFIQLSKHDGPAPANTYTSRGSTRRIHQSAPVKPAGWDLERIS